jgi:hypothetical protein
MGADFSQIGPFLFAALAVFIIYRRLRRSFGQQPLRRVRMQVRIVVLLIVGCLLLPLAWRSTEFLAAVFAGVAAGVALALWGAARTRFLKIDQQLYYVPHTYTGIAVSLLFLGRFVYRLVQVYLGTHATQAAGLDSAEPAFASANMLRSPLTVGLFFAVVGYYVCYYSVVLWKSKRVIAEEVSSGPTPLSGELRKRA